METNEYWKVNIANKHPNLLLEYIFIIFQPLWPMGILIPYISVQPSFTVCFQ